MRNNFIVSIALILLLAIFLTLIIGYTELYFNQKGDLERQIGENEMECQREKNEPSEGLKLPCLGEIWAVNGGWPFPFVSSNYGLSFIGGFNIFYFIINAVIIALILFFLKISFWFFKRRKKI